MTDPTIRPVVETGDAVLHEQSPRESFRAHLWDAIKCNWQRKRYYADHTSGASKKLSNHLIVSEFIALPVALLFDLLAKRFQNRGIAIVSGDFVSMKTVKSPDTPPKYRCAASDDSFRQIKADVKAYRQALQKALSQNDFWSASVLTYTLIQSIENQEIAERCHYAMYKHIAESVGLATLHAADHSEASHGASNQLAMALIAVQAQSLTWVERIDRQAQMLHRNGVGIIVNDVPDIPFKQAYETRIAKRC
jgi:hypothetical protein